MSVLNRIRQTVAAPRWSWNAGIADVFDAHAAASIPLYESGHLLTLELSDWFAVPGRTIYDLGCSTGSLTSRLAARHPSSRVIGVDAEPAMIRAAAERWRAANLEFTSADVADVELARPSLVVAHHLTPFLTLAERASLIRSAHDALEPGGALILFEKTCPADAPTAAIAASCLATHKLAHGLEADAVLAKERALRGVMMLRTVAHVETELTAAGFQRVTSVMRWLNWDGFLAVKGER